MYLDEKAPVAMLMTDRIVALRPAQSINEARQLFERCGVHHLPVIEGDRTLIGIVSHTDLYLKGIDITFPEDAVAENEASGWVEEVMRPDPVTIDARDTVELACGIFAEGAFHALPVVEKGNLVGMLTTSDLFSALLSSTESDAA